MYLEVHLRRKIMRKLLKESDIRHMMKLANIPALSDGFINKLQETSIYEQEEEEDEFGPPPEDVDLPGGLEAPEDVEGAEDLEAPEDLETPEDLEGGEALGAPATVESGLEGLSAFLDAVTDHEVGPQLANKIQVEKTDEEGVEGEEELGLPPEEEAPEGEEELGAEFEVPPEVGGEEVPEEELEEAQIEMVEDDDFVNEIVRRVAKRLLKR
jgi:hypothetical protein